MAYYYSQPSRETDPHTLPDLEVWQDTVYDVSCRCGDYEIADPMGNDVYCPSCEKPIPADNVHPTKHKGWFYWFCFPGCLPDSEANGPFGSEAAALADARDGIEDDEVCDG